MRQLEKGTVKEMPLCIVRLQPPERTPRASFRTPCYKVKPISIPEGTGEDLRRPHPHPS